MHTLQKFLKYLPRDGYIAKGSVPHIISTAHLNAGTIMHLRYALHEMGGGVVLGKIRTVLTYS
jgi:hypothetical protein